MTLCPYCLMNTAGQHADDCPTQGKAHNWNLKVDSPDTLTLTRLEKIESKLNRILELLEKQFKIKV